MCHFDEMQKALTAGDEKNAKLIGVLIAADIMLKEAVEQMGGPGMPVAEELAVEIFKRQVGFINFLFKLYPKEGQMRAEIKELAHSVGIDFDVCEPTLQ